ncbi:hypothetical protein GW756_00315 [bacterium]|nr:hypothetical protein [bacterium]NCQ54801.1 hypothetical protein [Candidatus Parcubacteria bacterium]NCS66845.1 hypothetical protein [Candidatus Peregrinibacteria bacterium]NCS95791.1 hypothetical protein [bacterium]
MKLEYLQKIIARIQTQIHCPKCKAPFAKEKIEIQGVKGHQVEFSAECAECKARSQISAEISGPNVVPPVGPVVAPLANIAPPDIKLKRPVPGIELPQPKLNVDQLTEIKSKLSGFKGSDIKSLFEE